MAATKARKPVVVLLHGSGGNGPEVLTSSRMQAVADARGFIVVMPSGGKPLPELTARDRQEHYAWDIPGFRDSYTTGTDADDGFLARLLPLLPDRLCVDRARTYMAGFSGGGRMTSQFGCRHRDLVAAIAPVSGLRAGAPVDPDGDGATVPGECTNAGLGRPPLPVISFHGTADDANPYDGTPTSSEDRTRWGYAVPTALARWASINGCTQPSGTRPPTEAAVAGQPTVRHLYYVGCAGGSVVQLFRTTSGGHVWPAGASDLIWQRFAAHRR